MNTEFWCDNILYDPYVIWLQYFVDLFKHFAMNKKCPLHYK